ncbi:ExeA family protein [Methylomicrobium lacus]|uniref:ExeA family protein n=1 Tax=Methylomicrobium lacus TaxID=136992 RepID=UPI0004BC5109|nr:AAA family ATPase [Methylomicrobium lacus]
MSLESLPFENLPDPAYFFDLDYYRYLLSRMMDSLWAERSLMVVAGPSGSEKAAFTEKLMASVSENTRIIWLAKPPASSDDLLFFLTQELQISPESPDRTFVLRDIKEYVLKLHNEGNRCLVIMEEAHKISDDVLECVRLLNNLEQGSMYINHFALQNMPFENVADPSCFFNQGDYSRVLSRMIDSLSAGKGLMVVAGPIGTGKTTLSQKLIISVPEQTRIIWLGEPPETSEELLLFLTQELHISPQLPGRVFVLKDIKESLLKLLNEGNRCLLIIDEVHKIADEVLECVRLLNNLEQGSFKLIQILLVGQDDFLVKLNRPNLESFKQRIAWLESIGQMTPLQTYEYILHRLKVAGSQSSIFTDDALETVIYAARGTPRLINTFCDRALRISYEANKTIVDLDSVRQAADEIGLGGEVFLRLVNRRGEETQQKVAPQASYLKENTETIESDTRRMESPPVGKVQSAPTHQDKSSWLFTILLLLGSLLLLAASLLFYTESM